MLTICIWCHGPRIDSRISLLGSERDVTHFFVGAKEVITCRFGTRASKKCPINKLQLAFLSPRIFISPTPTSGGLGLEPPLSVLPPTSLQQPQFPGVGQLASLEVDVCAWMPPFS